VEPGWPGRAKPLRSMPLRLALARAVARLATLAPGQCSPAGRLVGVLRSIPALAAPQGPVCEVRLLVVHRYQPGVQKLGATPCEVEFYGRRGKPATKMRLIPAKKAFAVARKLQRTPGCRLVAVLWQWAWQMSVQPSEAMATRTSRRPRKSSTARTRRTASPSTDSVAELPGISTVRRQCSQLHLAVVDTGTQAAIQGCE
jgi:hypothetical protein